MNLGPTELIIILAIVLLLFGSRKLPDLARSLGKSQREFKKGIQEAEADEEEPSPPKDAPTSKPEQASGSSPPP
jgi:sec-independent protein translocase protein TatA